MIEQVEYKGEWSVPNKGIWYSGVLTFSPEDGADLEIYGSFNGHFLDRKAPKIIIGKTSKGDVTLVDNIYKSTKHTHSTGITISQYAPSCIIIGHHFTSEEKMLFRSASFRLFNLFDWLSVTGIKFHSNNNIHDYSLKYLKPPSIKV